MLLFGFILRRETSSQPGFISNYAERFISEFDYSLFIYCLVLTTVEQSIGFMGNSFFTGKFIRITVIYNVVRLSIRSLFNSFFEAGQPSFERMF